MTPFTGRKQSLSIGKEAVWGVPVPTVQAIPHTGYDKTLKIDVVESATKLGSRALQGFIRVNKEGSANIPFEATPVSIGWFLKGILGKEIYTPGANGAPHSHKFVLLDDAVLPSWTLLAGSGGYKVYQLVGAVANTFNLTIAPKAIVKGSVAYNFKNQIDTSRPFIPNKLAGTNSLPFPGHGLANGNLIRFFALEGDVLPAPLKPNLDYAVSVLDADTIEVLDSQGAPITFIDGGQLSGQNSFEIIVQDSAPIPPLDFLTYADGSISIQGKDSSEVRNASISISDNLSMDDFRLGNAGLLASIIAGKFDVKFKIQVVVGPDTMMLFDAYNNSVSIPLVLKLTGKGGVSLTFTMTKCMITNWKENNADSGITADLDISAVNDNGTPITVELLNYYASAY